MRFLVAFVSLLPLLHSHPVHYLIGRHRNLPTAPRTSTATTSPSPEPSNPYGLVLQGPFFKLDARVPLSSCPQIETEYLDVIKTNSGHLRIPHSRIITNGHRCGSLPDTASMKELLADPYMELIPIDQLTSRDVADTHGVLGAYTKLNSKRAYTSQFFDYVLKDHGLSGGDPLTYIGYERYNTRQCGDVALDIESIVFIGTVVELPANVTGLIPRLQQGSTHRDIKFIPGREFHVTFTPNGTNPEHVCPSVLRRRTVFEIPDARQCFPSGMKVLSKRGVLDVSEVNTGDYLHDGTDWSQVVLLTHRDDTTVSEFVEIILEDGLVVQASRGHFMISAVGLISAGRVVPGMLLETSKGISAVSKVNIVTKKGLYNMQTASGKVVVSGVVASCYTEAVAPFFAHSLLTPVRFAWSVLGVMKIAWESSEILVCIHACQIFVRTLAVGIKARSLMFRVVET